MSFESWYERWIRNPKAKVIAQSLRDEPDEWRYDEFRYTVMRNNLEVWIGHGRCFLEIYAPLPETLGLIGRIEVWSAYKDWKKPVDRRRRLELLEKKRAAARVNQVAINAWDQRCE